MRTFFRKVINITSNITSLNFFHLPLMIKVIIIPFRTFCYEIFDVLLRLVRKVQGRKSFYDAG